MPKRRADASKVIDMIDGALDDYEVSQDAMRWSPEDEPEAAPRHPTTREPLQGYHHTHYHRAVAADYSIGNVRPEPDPLGIREPQVDRRHAMHFWIPVVGGYMHRSIVNVPRTRPNAPRTFVVAGHPWRINGPVVGSVDFGPDMQQVTYYPHWVHGTWGGQRWRARILALHYTANEADLNEAIHYAFSRGWHPIDSLSSTEINEVIEWQRFDDQREEIRSVQRARMLIDHPPLTQTPRDPFRVEGL